MILPTFSLPSHQGRDDNGKKGLLSPVIGEQPSAPQALLLIITVDSKDLLSAYFGSDKETYVYYCT